MLLWSSFCSEKSGLKTSPRRHRTRPLPSNSSNHVLAVLIVESLTRPCGDATQRARPSAMLAVSDLSSYHPFHFLFRHVSIHGWWACGRPLSKTHTPASQSIHITFAAFCCICIVFYACLLPANMTIGHSPFLRSFPTLQLGSAVTVC
jgi:hypothetical protein